MSAVISHEQALELPRAVPGTDRKERPASATHEREPTGIGGVLPLMGGECEEEEEVKGEMPRGSFYKKIRVVCPHCSETHEYTILVRCLTDTRVYASRAVDCDHHCKSYGNSIEPIPYHPCNAETTLKMERSQLYHKMKNCVKERIFIPATNGGYHGS